MTGYYLIIGGLVLGGLGGWLVFRGTQLTARADTEGLEKLVNNVFTEIKATRESINLQPTKSQSDTAGAGTKEVVAARNAQERLSEIEQDFSEKAASYIKNRDIKKLALDRQRLEDRARELELSKTYRPFLQGVIDDIRAATRAYQSEAHLPIQCNLKDLPINLWEGDLEWVELGTVEFPGKVVWGIALSIARPAAVARGIPYITLDVRDPRFKPGSSDQIRFNATPEQFFFTQYGGGIVAAAKAPDHVPLSSAKQSISTVIQALVEVQLSSLPPQ